VQDYLTTRSCPHSRFTAWHPGAGRRAPPNSGRRSRFTAWHL